jgi:hypothetical protein
MTDNNDFLADDVTPEEVTPITPEFTVEEQIASVVEDAPIAEATPIDKAPIAEATPIDIAPVAEEEPVVDNSAALAALAKERAKIDEYAFKLTDEIAVKKQAADDFAVWVEHHRRTFLWKMLTKMDEQKTLISNKQAEYESIVNGVELPLPGELVRYRKRFHKTVLSGLVGVSAAYLIWWLIINYLPYGWVAKFAVETSQIMTWLVSFFFSLLFGALVLYYRDWRRFDWKVKTLNRQLRDVAEGVDHVRREEVRLASLYPQVKDWLEIIGYSLNRPWSMNDKWFKSYIADLNQDEFPFSLRIAQAQESDPAAMHELQGNTMKRFAVRGWRTRVLKDQIQAIAQKVGLPIERMNVDGVDQDISYSPGGPRNELRKGLENVEALELVARRQLIPLTFKVQSEEITKSRPPVKENRTNLLDAIQADLAGLEEEERIDWDAFLKEPIGPFEGIITPFSLASISRTEISQGHHEKMKSHFVVPKRLEELALSNPGARVETYDESANLPMDIVIRMDLSEKIPPHAIKINPKFGEKLEPAASATTVQQNNSTDEDHDDD